MDRLKALCMLLLRNELIISKSWVQEVMWHIITVCRCNAQAGIHRDPTVVTMLTTMFLVIAT